MSILPAVLFGIFVSGLSWILLRSVQTRSLVAGRISGLPSHVSFPYDLAKESPAGSKNKGPTTLDDSYQGKVTRQLFLAGFRTQGQVRILRFLLQLGLILPAALGLLYALTGTLTLGSVVSLVFLGLGVGLCVPLLVLMRKRNRQKRIRRSLPPFLDLLTVSIEAGLNFSAALARVLEEVDQKDPLTQEFRLMHYEFLNGLPLTQCCDRLAHRCEIPDLSIILSAVVQSEQMGSALANTLRVQADELRDKHRQRMREKAYQIPVKMMFPIGLVFITLFVMTLGPAGYRLAKTITEADFSKKTEVLR